MTGSLRQLNYVATYLPSVGTPPATPAPMQAAVVAAVRKGLVPEQTAKAR